MDPGFVHDRTRLSRASLPRRQQPAPALAAEMNRPEILSRLDSLSDERRWIVAIAGPPGAGKSAFADDAAEFLNRSSTARAQVLPMDGFHFDDGLLTTMGRLPRKGAPDTFDIDGLSHVLMRLSGVPARDVVVPVFDRRLEIARAGARVIRATTSVVLVEGNYLLCRDAPWSVLHRFFDLTIMIEVQDPELRRRLRDRWFGYGQDADEIRRKLDENDIPNARHVKRTSVKADLIYRQ